MTTGTPGALGEAVLTPDTEAGRPDPVEFETGLVAQAADGTPLEPSGRRLPFGWRWISRLLLLRRWQVIYVLIMTGIIYALSLVFPVCTQMAVDSIVAGRTGVELASHQQWHGGVCHIRHRQHAERPAILRTSWTKS